jgi:hypothetical protein
MNVEKYHERTKEEERNQNDETTERRGKDTDLRREEKARAVEKKWRFRP